MPLCRQSRTCTCHPTASSNQVATLRLGVTGQLCMPCCHPQAMMPACNHLWVKRGNGTATDARNVVISDASLSVLAKYGACDSCCLGYAAAIKRSTNNSNLASSPCQGSLLCANLTVGPWPTCIATTWPAGYMCLAASAPMPYVWARVLPVACASFANALSR